MTRIVDLDPGAMTATVEAGVVNLALREAAASEGLLYAPDPASYEFSTIGGNVATNAGGLCCVKYGVTRDAVLALEAVRADSSLLRVGHTTRKGVTGYDLAGLLCGSEGTLAIVTEATVRLLPTPPAARGDYRTIVRSLAPASALHAGDLEPGARARAPRPPVRVHAA
jgi:glycolate oxidase